MYRKLLLLPDINSLSDGDSLMVTITNIKDLYGNSTAINQVIKSTDDFGPSWSFIIPDVDGVYNDPYLDTDSDGKPDTEDICVFAYNPKLHIFSLIFVKSITPRYTSFSLTKKYNLFVVSFNDSIKFK